MDTLAYHFKGLDLEENVRNIVGSGVGQNNATTPIKGRGRGVIQWEAEANVWLAEQVFHLNLGGKSELISNLISINSQIVGRFGFGDEIRAHQELEGYLQEKMFITFWTILSPDLLPEIQTKPCTAALFQRSVVREVSLAELRR